MTAGEQVDDVSDARQREYPCETEMPLQRAAQPSAESHQVGEVQKILLRNLRTEARESHIDLQPAHDHHQQRDRVQPVSEAHQPWMFAREYHSPAVDIGLYRLYHQPGFRSRHKSPRSSNSAVP